MSARRKIAQALAKVEQRNGSLYCPVCQSRVQGFLPHGNPPREHVKCPICHSKACHRLAWAFFQSNPDIFRPNGVFLHIAPEQALGSWLRRSCSKRGMHYMHGDIRDERHFIDLQNIGMEDGSIDVLFACHVLNMVEDDREALQEIRRVLRPEGIAVIPVPFQAPGQEMKEASASDTAKDRLDLFNDPAMHRAYTRQVFAERLSAADLSLVEFTADQITDASAWKWKLVDKAIQVAVAAPHRGPGPINPSAPEEAKEK